MKVFISADLEGIWGVVSRKQTGWDKPDYTRARKLMTDEVNLLCEELFAHGVTEVIVNDSHDSMDNILIELLHPDVNLINGYPKDLSMMEGVDSGVDCAMLIGYHPKAGTPGGIFDHTYAGRVVNKLIINGETVGETGLNALVAGHFGVPVVLVAGDHQVTQDALSEIGPIATVAVKKALSRYCARHLSQNQLKTAYAEAVTEALASVPTASVKRHEGHFALTLELAQAVMADKAASIPGVSRANALTVSCEASDAVTLYQLFRAMVTLAGSVL
ncbi:M55 family metallopeptidase [Anoxynatronum sibiricum]|uniref:M55 family metallopeptidase n=1 Tax=Anoxynatronum sibiricum TaxID=210623 RepID=A0ABU9VTM1_9CLOT